MLRTAANAFRRTSHMARPATFGELVMTLRPQMLERLPDA